MSNLTDYLIGRSGGLIKTYPEVLDEGKGYWMFDDGGVEVEVGEFLHGLVKVLKPKRVLTTGVYTGISDMYIAQGLVENGYGASTALEFDSYHLNRAKDLWKRVGVDGVVTGVLGPSLDFQPEGQYELMFLDTEPNLRFKELVKFYDFLAPGGFVFIHDLHRHMSQEPNSEHGFGHPFGELPTKIKSWVKDRELNPIHFPTPRGFMGFYKRDPRDFNWK